MARRCGQPPRAGPSAWGQRPLRSLLWAVRSQPPGPDQPCPCLPESVATGLSIPEHSLGTGSDLGALGRPFSAAPSRTFRVLSSKCRGADSGLGAMSSVGPQPVQQGREGPSTRLWGASSDPPFPSVSSPRAGAGGHPATPQPLKDDGKSMQQEEAPFHDETDQTVPNERAAPGAPKPPTNGASSPPLPKTLMTSRGHCPFLQSP